MVHRLKTDATAFERVTRGAKKAEFRRDDRGFEVGDFMELDEYIDDAYTGRRFYVRISDRTVGYGIPDGFVMLSFDFVPAELGRDRFGEVAGFDRQGVYGAWAEVLA